LFSYEQAKQLSIELLKEWLVKYKFKNWKRTKTHKHTVTRKMRKDRAEEIGKKLSKTDEWFSHSRGISMQVLKRKLNLQIEDIDAAANVRDALRNYYELLENYLGTIGASGALHTSDLLVPFG
jgi:protein-arginine kinase activator protein McsA